MKLYKFKITFEKQPNFLREILIKPAQTFKDFHLIIKKCVGLKSNELASFYICNKDYKKINEITLIDMSEKNSQKLIMKNCTIKNFVNKTDKYFIYEYDFLHLQTFKIEFIGIEESEKGQKYPKCITSKEKLQFNKTHENFNISDVDKEALLKDFDEILKNSYYSDLDE